MTYQRPFLETIKGTINYYAYQNLWDILHHSPLVYEKIRGKYYYCMDNHCYRDRLLKAFEELKGIEFDCELIYAWSILESWWLLDQMFETIKNIIYLWEVLPSLKVDTMDEE